MTKRFDTVVESALLQAGWHPKWTVKESVLEKWYAFPFKNSPLWHRIHPHALKALREFGGLSVIQDYPGVTGYRTSFYIDPLRASGYQDFAWINHEWLLGQALFPLGIHGDSEDEVLAMSHDGKVFSLFSGIMSGIWLMGNNFDEALHKLILGINVDSVRIGDERDKRAQATKISNFIQRVASSPDEHD